MKITGFVTVPIMALVLAGCVTLRGEIDGAQFQVVPPMEPTGTDAVINFYHPIGLEDVPVPLSLGAPGAPLPLFFKSENLYQLWDDQGLVGFLPVASNCLQVRVKPGKQIFLGRFVRGNAGNWTVLEGDVAAGKTYFIKVSQRWNTWKPSVVFEAPAPGELAAHPVASCRTPLAYARATGASAAFWDRHVAANREAVKAVFSDLANGGRGYYLDPELKP